MAAFRIEGRGRLRPVLDLSFGRVDPAFGRKPVAVWQERSEGFVLVQLSE